MEDLLITDVIESIRNSSEAAITEVNDEDSEMSN